MRPQAYKIIVSSGPAIRIDYEEVSRVLTGISDGKVVMLKQGILNPSFFVSIVEDTERIKEYFDEVDRKKHFIREGIEKTPEFKKLKNIFEEVILLEEKVKV